MTLETVGPINPDHQAALIFASFATWIAQGPGRRIVLSRDGAEWQCALEERRDAHGLTLQDASAQGAQIASVDDAEP